MTWQAWAFMALDWIALAAFGGVWWAARTAQKELRAMIAMNEKVVGMAEELMRQNKVQARELMRAHGLPVPEALSN